MPQLPSGRHAALSADYALALARQGNLALSMAFILEARSAEDIAPLVNVIYFRPIEGKEGPGEPYPSGLMLPDIGTEKCDWFADDVFRLAEGKQEATSGIHGESAPLC